MGLHRVTAQNLLGTARLRMRAIARQLGWRPAHDEEDKRLLDAAMQPAARVEGGAKEAA